MQPSQQSALEAVVAKAPESCRLRDEQRGKAYLDAQRAMDICNACRYCEGFCSVFPAMTLRRAFTESDLDYLANLCHNCRGCFYSCQYAPPHVFGVNVPKVFAELRSESYEKYAWPRPLARLFRENGTALSLATVLGISIVLALTLSLSDPAVLYAANDAPGAFYAIIPWAVMAGTAGGSLAFSAIVLAVSGLRFWRGTGGGTMLRASAWRTAASDALTLRNLGSNGAGCNDLDERYSTTRRRFHHALFYGFALCFAATSVAAIYDHFLHRTAPYPFLSLPVQLGFWGGIGMLIGASGLAWIKVCSDPRPTAPKVRGGDFALLALLALISISGLLLLGLRASSAMGILLAIHLGTVLTFFVFAPYSKMVHGLYRSLALLRSATERSCGR